MGVNLPCKYLFSPTHTLIVSPFSLTLIFTLSSRSVSHLYGTQATIQSGGFHRNGTANSDAHREGKIHVDRDVTEEKQTNRRYAL